MMDFIFYILFYGSIIAGLVAILVLIAVCFIRYARLPKPLVKRG